MVIKKNDVPQILFTSKTSALLLIDMSTKRTIITTKNKDMIKDLFRVSRLPDFRTAMGSSIHDIQEGY
jgi:hypothetical protein